MDRPLPRVATGVIDRMSKWLARVWLGIAMVATFSVEGGADLLQPLSASGDTPPAPWQVMGLPRQQHPYTHFSLVDIDGRRAVRVEADNSYGNLVQTLNLPRPPRTLSWQWRIETLNTAADLRHKQTDDTTLKVCVFFDLPLKSVPFIQRQLLRVARITSSMPLPAATMCYVWDPTLPEGTTLPNAYTGQVRYLVATTSDAHDFQWRPERRDIVADFLSLFGDETTEVPPIVGVGIGADADNTHMKSVGYVADLALAP